MARRDWDSYAAAMARTLGPSLNPAVVQAARVIARTMVTDLIGFSTTWRLHGGSGGMERYG